MEKILSFAAIVLLSVLFNFIQERVKKQQNKKNMKQAGISAPARFHNIMQEIIGIPDAVADSDNDSRPIRHGDAPASVDNHSSKEKNDPAYIEGPQLRNTPDATSKTGNDGITDPTDTEEAERAAHFNRWRQAVIDSEILRKKY